jgi:probable phosphoglycerate mutase
MSDSTRIYLVRHGATTSTNDDLYAGAIDPELSEDGLAQARALAKRLESVDFAAAYCSEKLRAHRTAEEICAPHRLTPTVMTDLREMSHGHWEGKPRQLVRERYANEYARVSADPVSLAPLMGETGSSELARSLRGLAMTPADHVGQRVLVVSHTGTNRLMLCALLGIDPRRYRDRIAQDLACLNILDYRGPGQVRLLLLNDTTHYRGI